MTKLSVVGEKENGGEDDDDDDDDESITKITNTTANSSTEEKLEEQQDDNRNNSCSWITNSRSILDNPVLDSTEEQASVQQLEAYIQKLQAQLFQTQQEEIQEVQDQETQCQAAKEAVARTMRDEYLAQQQQQQQQQAATPRFTKGQLKEMMDALQLENHAQRKHSQALNYQLIAMQQHNAQLAQATQTTLQCVRDLERIHYQYELETHQQLAQEWQDLQDEMYTVQHQLTLAVNGAQKERTTRKKYQHDTDAIVDFFRLNRRHFYDEDVLQIISNFPVVVVRPMSKMKRISCDK
jgi:hypothetical protein